MIYGETDAQKKKKKKKKKKKTRLTHWYWSPHQVVSKSKWLRMRSPGPTEADLERKPTHRRSKCLPTSLLNTCTPGAIQELGDNSLVRERKVD
jgi:hypothetical protein